MSARMPVWACRCLKRRTSTAEIRASVMRRPAAACGRTALLSARPVDACAPSYDRGFDALTRGGVAPIAISPATGKRNEIGPDVVLAQDLERLVRWWCAFVREGVDALLSCCHRLACERLFRTSGLLGGGRWVGRLLGQPKRPQSCSLFPEGPRLRLVVRPAFLRIVSGFLRLLGLCVSLVASLRMVRQCRLLVPAREMRRWATSDRV